MDLFKPKMKAYKLSANNRIISVKKYLLTPEGSEIVTNPGGKGQGDTKTSVAFTPDHVLTIKNSRLKIWLPESDEFIVLKNEKPIDFKTPSVHGLDIAAIFEAAERPMLRHLGETPKTSNLIYAVIVLQFVMIFLLAQTGGYINF